MNADQLINILNTDPFNPLLEHPHKIRNPDIAHAPKRPLPLSDDEKRVCCKNLICSICMLYTCLNRDSSWPLKTFFDTSLSAITTNWHRNLRTSSTSLVISMLIASCLLINWIQLPCMTYQLFHDKRRLSYSYHTRTILQNDRHPFQMILNNLDPKVAQFPEELVTYGGNGQVFSNWIQFRLVLACLQHISW